MFIIKGFRIMGLSQCDFSSDIYSFWKILSVKYADVSSSDVFSVVRRGISL